MKEKLFDFQQGALDELVGYVRTFNELLVKNPREHAILTFSAPTGSGKTLVLAAMMESLLFPSAGSPGDPDSIFVWLSDLPELNEQSRMRIERVSNKLRPSFVSTIESDFDAETLEPGHIYFLNTQKLGERKLLTRASDTREHTIWETLSNTAASYRGRFYLIIDEAHRGTKQSRRAEQEAQSIMQKFILGSPTDGLARMPLVIGVTATPKRFERLVENASGLKASVNIDPEDVRETGLLKDRVVLHYPDLPMNADMTMFGGAVADWRIKTEQWAAYCEDQHLPEVVRPALVLQVADGKGKARTETDLSSYLGMLETLLGRELMPGEVVHCLDDKTPITVGKWTIPYLEPAHIEDDPLANFVIFKMSLSTGWDCPRAEVIMSFRSAKDHTYIAQLIGRMVRTPLAMRIPTNDELNEVSLYLPHYDEVTVESVIASLKSSEDAMPSKTVTDREAVLYWRDPEFEDVFDEIRSRAVTYRLEGSSRENHLKRLFHLCMLLKYDGIDTEEFNRCSRRVARRMQDRIEELREDGSYDQLARGYLGIDVDAIAYDFLAGETYSTDGKGHMVVNPFDLNSHFQMANKSLGYGIGSWYWSMRHNQRVDDDVAKVEAIVASGDDDLLRELESWSERRFSELYREHRERIEELGADRTQEYDRVIGDPIAPKDVDWKLPESISFTKDGQSRPYRRHLYADESGEFETTLNSWEHGVLLEELNAGAHAWLRNLPRKPWSLSIPYTSGDSVRAMYPDLVIVRRTDRGFAFDALEPHDSSRGDNLPKAKGMADFAQKHSQSFGRIQLIRRMVGPDGKERFCRLDMGDPIVRHRVGDCATNDQLDQVFEDYGC